MPKGRRIAVNTARMATTIACFWLLSRLGGGPAVYRNLLGIGVGLFLLRIIVTCIRVYLMGLRWQVLAPGDSRPLSGWEYFRLTFYGMAFNLVMPGALGGDMVRSVMVANKVKQERTKNALSVFADRFVGLFTIMVLGALATVFSGPIPNRIRYLGLFFFMIVGSLVALALAQPLSVLIQRTVNRPASGRLRRAVLSVFESLDQMMRFYATKPIRVAIALFLSIPINALIYLVFYLAAKRTGIDISFAAVTMVTSLVWLISAIPISMSGFGVREVSNVFLLVNLGVSRDLATTYAVYIVSLTLIGSATALVFVMGDMLARVMREAVRRCKAPDIPR